MPWKEEFLPKILKTYNIYINVENILVSIVKTDEEANYSKMLNLSVTP